MGLTLTILGCSGSFPTPQRACSGYLVRTEATAVWVDAGSGTLANLQRHVPLADVDAVVISHEHPDHAADLAGFAVACKYHLERSDVPVYAPASVRSRAYHAGPPLHWNIVSSGDRAIIGDLTFTFSRTDHGPETMAMRIEGEGRSLGYSADSGPRWRLTQLGPGLDAALCEASYLQHDEGKAQHMSARQAGMAGREAGVGRLLLTHLQPAVDRAAVKAEAESVFGRQVDIVADHEVYEV